MGVGFFERVGIPELRMDTILNDLTVSKIYLCCYFKGGKIDNRSLRSSNGRRNCIG
jgi:hypothetical protein